MKKAIIIVLVVVLVCIALVFGFNIIKKGNNDALDGSVSNETENQENQSSKGLDTTGPSGYELVFLSDTNDERIAITGSILDTYVKKTVNDPDKITVNGVELLIQDEISLEEMYEFLEGINKTCPISDNGTYLEIDEDKTLGMSAEEFEDAIISYNGNSSHIDITFEVPYVDDYDNGVEQEELTNLPTVEVRFGARTTSDCQERKLYIY